jgi:integrase
VPAIITAATITKARADARPGAPRYEIVDARARGLVLRVSPTGAQWQLRYAVNGRDKRLALGSVDMWSIADARDLVGRAQRMLRDRTGIPDEDWLDRRRKAAGKGEVVRQAEEVSPRMLFKWTFAQGRKVYIDEIKRTRRPDTAADYEFMLGRKEMLVLDDRPLPTITRAEIAGIVAKIHASGRESTAEHIVRVVTPFWKWLAQDRQASRSGIQLGVMDGLRAPERTLDEDDEDDDVGYVPPMEEVGRIVAICRSGVLHPVIAGAIELAAWTGQRRRAVVQARRVEFEDIGRGRGLWHVPPASRKTRTKSGAKKRDHVIPLPAPTWACVMRSMEHAEKRGSDYLFPQLRAGRGGQAKKSVSGSALDHNMKVLPGVLASPHDFRRSFATHGEDRFGLLRADTQAILDHAGGSRDVTGTHYALHDGTHRTWSIMQTWVDGLQPYIDAAIAALEPVEELRAAIARARYGDDEDRAAAE